MFCNTATLLGHSQFFNVNKKIHEGLVCDIIMISSHVGSARMTSKMTTAIDF